MSNTEQGRNDLAAWKAAQPTNFWTHDRLFQRALHRLGGDDFMERMAPRLERFGAECATELDQAAIVNNRPHNLPRLERWDDIGTRVEAVEHHPSYHIAGRVIYESGMMGEYAEPGGFLRSLAFFTLSSWCGEAGHNCPVACTAGIIKALQGLGTPALMERYLPGLYSDRYAERLDGAQFLTEVQGGSDVGQNAVRAEDAGDGTWRIHGEKWFCSNADADLILMTARYADDVEGTRGLGLFLVPRILDSGEVNHFSIRRLKDKLGTRSMPSGEMDFNGAVAWPLGSPEAGFKNMMRFVINTSRLYNGIAVTGLARRAWAVASGYAEHRRAFGQPIGEFALVRETLEQLDAGSAAIAIGTLDLAPLFDAMEAGTLDEEEAGFLRMAIGINKRRSSITATECALKGIEVLGGNGAIESFSVLPRLLRDAIVCENWEGTHNTLTAQVLRDMHRYRMHQPFLAGLRRRVEETRTDALGDFAAVANEAVDAAAAGIDEILGADEDTASLRMRPMMDRLAWLLYGTGLARQAAFDARHGGADETLPLLRNFWRWRLVTPGWAKDFHA